MTALNSHFQRVLSGADRKLWRRGPRPGIPSLGFLLGVAVLAGCKSASFSSYTAPRVTGRVVAADTGQPLANVRIQRVDPAANQDYDAPARGGQKLDSAASVRTDAQGRFVLQAEHALTFLQPAVWPSVTAAFQLDGYQTLRTNFNLLQASTNAPGGAPVVNAGDIRLRPRSQ